MKPRFMIALISVWLAGCIGSSQVSVTPTPVATSTARPSTPTAVPTLVKPRLVSNGLIHDYYWTPDGQTLVYAQSEKCPNGCKTTWYQFEVATGVTATIKPKIVTIDPEVWKRLTNDTKPPEISPQQSRSISPSGKWVIYSRVQAGYVPSCIKGPCPPPMEVWAAKIDGSNAFKVADASEYGTFCIGMGWFDQEQKALLMCGYEGPVHFVVADLQKHELVNFSDIARQSVITLHGAELSPDGSRLMVINILTKTVALQVFPVNGSAMTDLGYPSDSHWSSDGQRLYYLPRATPDKCTPTTIRVYDFLTKQNGAVLGPDVALSSAQQVALNACDHAFLVSSTENAVLLNLGKEGSWVVPLPH